MKPKQASSEYQHVYRSDIACYYASIQHEILLSQLELLVPDARVVSLIASSLTSTETYRGHYFDINCGISRGSPLSPLLGSIFLKPLDDAMEKSSVYYVRFMDDWCIMAKSKFKLRHAIKKMHRILEQLRLKTHPDKTFIGSVEKSFSFLGYQFCNKQLRIAQASFEKHKAKRLRLQEQQTPPKRLVDYGRRWLGWFMSGVDLAAGYVGGVKSGILMEGKGLLRTHTPLR